MLVYNNYNIIREECIMDSLKKVFSVVLALTLCSTMFFGVLPVNASEIPEYSVSYYNGNSLVKT